MLFKDIIGQEVVINKLQSFVAKDRISQAYLFSGKQGVGKLALAISFAQYIMCKNKKGGDSCGECPSCKKFQKLEHPDCHFVFPFFAKSSGTNCDAYIQDFRNQILDTPYFDISKWWDIMGDAKKEGIINRSESNNIIHKINLTSYESEYKVMIIWYPELMTQECANSILKTLEEPPHKTVFILVSNNSDKIMETISSRTQKIEIPNISNDEIRKVLIDKYHKSEDDAINLSKLSLGSWTRVLNLLIETEEIKRNFEHFTLLMRTCWGRKVLDLIKWSNTIAGWGREQQKSFLLYSIKMVRESFMNNFGDSSIIYANSKEEKFMERFSPFINEENLLILFKELNKAYQDIQRNANPKLVFLDMSLKLIKVIRP